MKRQLLPTERSQIVALLEQGLSVRKVATKFSISHSTVVRTKAKYDKTGFFEHSGNAGCPTVLTNAVLNHIQRENSVDSKKLLRKNKG